MTARVLVAEDNLLMRQGVVAAVTALGDTEIVAECESKDELLVAVVFDTGADRLGSTSISPARPRACESRSVVPADPIVYLAAHVIVMSALVSTVNRVRLAYLAEISETSRTLLIAAAELGVSRRRVIGGELSIDSGIGCGTRHPVVLPVPRDATVGK